MIQTVELPPGYRLADIGPRHWAVHELFGEVLTNLPVDAPSLLRTLPGAEAREGRVTHWSVETAAGRVLVRSCRRGGLVGGVLGSWYFRLGATPRPLAELQAATAAKRAGVAVPEILAAGWQATGPMGYRGWVVLREIPDAIPLAQLWDAEPPGPRRTAAIHAAGTAVARLHEAGFAHPDLNAGNILLQRVADAWRAWIVDFDRVRRLPRLTPRHRAWALWRLLRSCHKHREAGAPIPWIAASQFLGAYVRSAQCSFRELIQALRTTGPVVRVKWWLGDNLHVTRPAPTHSVSWSPQR